MTDLAPGDAVVSISYKLPCCGEILHVTNRMFGGFGTEHYDSHGINGAQALKLANNPVLGFWLQREISAHACVEVQGAAL